MLCPRIIPCLLVHDKGLIKTVNFKNSKYVGDPINAVRIYNEKEVDELMILDIDATVLNKEPNYKMIENIANECRMPLCYGGGIKTVEQAQKIFNLGVEKIALSSAAIEDIDIIKKITNRVGIQSVVIVLDVKKKFLGGYEVFIRNGKIKTGIDPIEFVQKLEKLGIGEIVINSIDNDGAMEGYDFNIIDKIKKIATVPITVLGGAGSLNDIKKVITKYKIIGVAAGSLFVFKGKYKAVLISYPNHHDKIKLIKNI